MPSHAGLPFRPLAALCFLAGTFNSTGPRSAGLYFYRNTGTREKPWFDEGVEVLTTEGRSMRAARREGHDSVSLLVRVEYTGPYVAGHGYAFCGSEVPKPEYRPRLCLTTRKARR